MAGHAYKAAVDELDTGVGRELVCSQLALYSAPPSASQADDVGCSFPDDGTGARWQAQLILYPDQRCHRQAEP